MTYSSMKTRISVKKKTCSFNVGNRECLRTGCIFEILIHEICHVLEYCFRSKLSRAEQTLGYSAEDDENTIFRQILYNITDHKTPFNNLLGRKL